MRLNGWLRLLIALSIAWLIIIGIIASIDYPNGGRFGGIPVDHFTYWTVVENTFQLGEAVAPPGFHYLVIEPNFKAFLVHGGVPVIALWLAYLSVCWVRRGFKKYGNALSRVPVQTSSHVQVPNAESAIWDPNATENRSLTKPPDGVFTTSLLLLRIVRAISGFVGGWQIVGLVPALSLLGNYAASTGADFGKLGAIVLVKLVFALFCFGIFFGLRSAINKLYFKRHAAPHPALIKRWGL